MERIEKIVESVDVPSVCTYAVPPVAVSSFTLLGLTLHEWIYVVTIIYTVIAIVVLIKKTFFPKIVITKEPNDRKKRTRRYSWAYTQNYAKRYARRLKKSRKENPPAL